MGSFSNASHALSDETAGLFLAVVGGGVWMVVGIVFLIIGVCLLTKRTRRATSCTAKTTGHVADLAVSTSGGCTMWSPVIQYEVDGLIYVKPSPYASSQVSYAIGEPVEVFYDPQNPHEYRIPQSTAGKGVAVVFTAVGAGCLVLGIAWLLFFSSI